MIKSVNAILFIALLFDPFPTISPFRRSTSSALGLVNVAPYVRPPTSRVVVRGIGSGDNGRFIPSSIFLTAPRGTLAGPLSSKTDHAPSDAAVESPDMKSVESSPEDITSQTIATGTPYQESTNNFSVHQRKGVWMPPSQNSENRRGNIYSIQKPQDLLDFVIEDERLSVVKVYASWCKTCKVFDIRYRKLASQLGDKFDKPQTGEDSQLTQKGSVRFAEMQYDNPDNEEMCKLLNATKLPYILMYKGSKGKVRDFQCSPGNFQILIDSVNELADPAVLQTAEEIKSDMGNLQPVSGKVPSIRSEDAATTSSVDAGVGDSVSGEDTISTLKQQLVSIQNEKLEMFETMKAQIEHDKEWIQKLETGVETQRLMLEDKGEEISKLQSILKDKETEIQSLTNNIKQQQEQNQQAKKELSAHQIEISQMTSRMSEIENNITSIELQSSSSKKDAQEKEQQLLQQIKESEKLNRMYEQERNSLRQLMLLGVKCVGRKVRSLFWRIKRKKTS